MPDEASQQLEPEATEAETMVLEPEGPEGAGSDEPDMAVPETDEVLENSSAEPEMAFSWQASEYVHHHKTASWYGVLFAIVAACVGLAALLHLWLEIGVFLAAAWAVIIYARKPPRTLSYELSDQGVHIDGKLHSFHDFRSFSVLPDEDWHSISLEPARRFSPRTILLFNSDDFEEIVGHLELHLPREERELDLIERLTRYIRF